MKQADHSSVHRQLDLIVRSERGRLIAGLVRHLGGSRLDLAEDVAQEAVLKAIAVWPYQGVPENPRAWLTRVARNKAIDRLRREKREVALPPVEASEARSETETALFSPVADEELQLICLCCHPDLKEMDRLALTVKIVSGFTAREVAEVFLLSESALAQRLVRSKRKLRMLNPRVNEPLSAFEVKARLPTVLKVVYLMFALAYAPRSGADLVLADLALEAVRLARELARTRPTAMPEADALAALLCLQASRFSARLDNDGEVVLLRDQDRTLWNPELVESGMRHLARSTAAGTVSRYHLEAGIAAAHATAPSWEETDWPAIGRYYKMLEERVDSPVVSINASVAQALSGDGVGALRRLDRLRDNPNLKSYGPYHIARAEVLSQLQRLDEAAAAFDRAIACGVSTPVERLLERRLATCL